MYLLYYTFVILECTLYLTKKVCRETVYCVILAAATSRVYCLLIASFSLVLDLTPCCFINLVYSVYKVYSSV